MLSDTICNGCDLSRGTEVAMKEPIEITQAVIDDATQARRVPFFTRASGCPIARAVRKRHPDWRVTETRIIDFNYDTVALLPGPAIAFIRDFDAGKSVEPFTFEIEI